MKKFFITVLGITFGSVLALAIIGTGVYWWFEVRTPAPPEITVELDGFPDTRKQKNGKENALVRIVVTNNEDNKISINDAYLYLTRVSDGARTNLRFDVGDMAIYPKEKYVDIVETMSVNKEWINYKDSDEFDSKDGYLAHKGKWIAQIKETFGFNFSFVSDNHNIRILLDTQEKIAEIENKDEFEKTRNE